MDARQRVDIHYVDKYVLKYIHASKTRVYFSAPTGIYFPCIRPSQTHFNQQIRLAMSVTLVLLLKKLRASFITLSLNRLVNIRPRLTSVYLRRKYLILSRASRTFQIFFDSSLCQILMQVIVFRINNK